MTEMRYIVRIANRDLNGNKPIYRALTGIKGIGTRMARILAYSFQEKYNIAFDTPIGNIPEDMDAKLEEMVLQPQKTGVPAWALNRRKTIDGADTHTVMNDLDFAIRNDLQTMKKLRSYKGVRHGFGLTVRGQRTRTSGRKVGVTVGVDKKKDTKPAKAAAPAPAGKKK